MVQPIVNPGVPFTGPIKGGLGPGIMVRIQGKAPPEADRFDINLHCGSPPSDIALHLSVRLLQNYIARNSFQNGEWGSEEDSGSLPIVPGQSFEILVLCDPGSYKIAVNGNHFCEFRHRVSFQDVTHVKIEGDVELTLIAYEGAPGGGGPSAPPPRAGGPDFMPNYGPPPGGPYGPPPPQGHVGYGGGPGYGPPPPHKQKEESGFDNFLETAGSMLAGAITTGVAQNLIGNLTGGGQGGQRNPQQQQQQPPPQQPQFQQGPYSSGSGGQQQQQQQPSFMGSILENLASEMLSPRKKN